MATSTATLLVFALPFELYPWLHTVAQEWYALQTVTILDALGTASTLEVATTSHLTVLRFTNGAFLEIVRACNGIYAAALFTAVVVGARASIRRKLGGIAFVIVVVFAVNQLRMVIVGMALANDWFGPLITDTETLQMTYYVAELGLGQSLVVSASVAGFVLLSRWIPDILSFVSALLEGMGVGSTSQSLRD